MGARLKHHYHKTKFVMAAVLYQTLKAHTDPCTHISICSKRTALIPLCLNYLGLSIGSC